jgi:hypothetical protein
VTQSRLVVVDLTQSEVRPGVTEFCVWLRGRDHALRCWHHDEQPVSYWQRDDELAALEEQSQMLLRWLSAIRGAGSPELPVDVGAWFDAWQSSDRAVRKDER